MADTDENKELDPLDKLVAKLDWAGCSEKVDVSVEENLARIADAFERSTQMVHRRKNAELSAKRQQFTESLVKALESAEMKVRVENLRKKQKDAASFEECFSELLTTLPTTPAGELAPECHVWALIELLAGTVATVDADLKRALTKMTRLFDPHTIFAENAEGVRYRPDAVLSQHAEVTASSIEMLSYQNKWFRQDGIVVVPARVSVTDSDTSAAGVTLYLGTAWDCVEVAEERWRFFGGEVEDGRIPTDKSEGEDGEIRCITYNPKFSTIDVCDHLSSERLNRFILDNTVQLQFLEASVGPIPEVGEPTKLAPEEYVSNDEALAAEALKNLFHFDVLGDTKLYGGLMFSEWLRGYSWLHRRAAGSEVQSLEEVSEATAIADLRTVGMSSDAAATFLQSVSLCRGRTDLFDTPLIRIENDSYVFHAGLVKNLNISRVVVSRLSRLRVAIGRKGAGFEETTLEVFNKANIEAKGVEFSRDGEQYQYDAVFVWDDTLFVVECKAYSLPMMKPMQLFWFIGKMGRAINQVKRLVGAAEKYPEEIKKQLDTTASWTSVVPIVLNSLPWSLGKTPLDVFIVDYSAVRRFLEDRTIFLRIQQQIGDAKILWRHHLKALYPESGPTPASFISAMEMPWQVTSLSSGVKAETGALTLSQSLAFQTAFLRTIPTSLQDLSESLGVPDPTAEVEAIEAQLDKLRTRLGHDPEDPSP